MIGQTLGHYAITHKIGQGGMGEVYLAIDQSLNRKVALKIIRPSKQDEISKQRFVSEARLAAAVQHPFVCKIHEVGEQEGRDYICMEFIEGRTLSEELKNKGALAFPEAVRLGLEICEALIAAHERGVIHRDLKPANIMLATDGHIRVLDFGLAKRAMSSGEETLAIDGLTEPGATIGTVGYMSPEQLLNRPLGVRSDIFALGIVFYEMASGSHPFRKSTSIETAHAILHGALLPVTRLHPAIPEWFERALGRMLAKDAGDRYESVQAIRADLRSSQSEPAAPTPSGPRDRPFVAVLPFSNLSRDPEQEFFSEGVTEDIVSKLCNLTVIRVIGRTSGHRYSIREHGAARIGAELKVTHILEGSVRRARDLVRINVGLIEVQSLRQIWGEVYDGSIDDVFAIQSEVAGKVASALHATFSGAAEDGAQASSSLEQTRHEPIGNESTSNGPIDIGTYELYLKGRFFLNRPMPDNIGKAIHLFELVIEARPRYARAWAALAACHATAAHFGYARPADAYPKARQAALRAIELNGRLAEALTWLAFVKGYYDWDWAGAEACFERAVQADSNSVEARVHYSRFLCAKREANRGVIHIIRAVELDPLAPLANTMAGWVMAMASRLNEAMPYFDRALEIDPGFGLAHACRSMAYAGMEKYTESIEEIKKWSWSPAFLGIAYGFAGRTQEARAIAEELSRPDSKPGHPSDVALIWLFAGERDKAKEWLGRAVAERDYTLALLTCPVWFPLRADPLIEDTLRRMGLDFAAQTAAEMIA
jgi:serine/threonine protein kinase/tetratricopeptide (TPR) repeat protein